MAGTVTDELNAILAMRTAPEYRAAERLRRYVTAEVMARCPESSEEYPAIRLLIGTWETIAVRVQGNAPLKTPFFQANPVGHMWDALAPAIKVIRGSLKGQTSTKRFYAANFEKLNKAYRTWLASQPASYRSAALQGINAQFG